MKDPDEGRPEDDGGFVGRWARRKSALRRGERPTEELPGTGLPIADVASDSASPVVAHTPDGQSQPAEDDADRQAVPVEKPPLPALDSLTPDSDFSAFMSRDVDAALRRAALRKLFHSPAMNITDGLDDYAEDFTNFAPLGDMITADMRHQMEVEEQRAERARLAAEEQAEAEAALGQDGATAGAGQETEAEAALGEDTTTADAGQEQIAGDESDAGSEQTPAGVSGAATAGMGERAVEDGAGREAREEHHPGDSDTGEDAVAVIPASSAEAGHETTGEPTSGDDETTARHNAAEQRPGDQTRG